MFFGNNQSREIDIDLLDKEVGALFDKKLEKFAARASKISERIDSARREFVAACDEFGKVSNEPDIEFKRWLNPNFIKSQKGAYTAALRGVFDSVNRPTGQMSYFKYSAELASLDAAITEMLSINGRNRDIIHAYSKYLGHFKYLQAALEGLAANLRTELGKVSTEFNEYNDVMTALAKLRSTCEEIGVLKRGLGNFEMLDVEKGGEKGDTSELEAKATSKKAELAKIKENIDKISFRVESLVLPLEKAARIYDHSAMKKVKLFEIVENPVESLASVGGFGEFNKMIEELKESIEKGRIDLKRPEETLSLISKIKEAKIYEELSRLALLKKEVSVARDEVKFFEMEIGNIKSRAWESESRMKKISDMDSAIKNLENSKREDKLALEQLITKYYKKNILVIL